MRYPQTMLVAGTVDLNLKSGPIHCPSPYGGVAPDSVVGCSGTVAYVLSVENLTVFHELALGHAGANAGLRSEEHTSELQSLMRISYAVFCLKKKKQSIKI